MVPAWNEPEQICDPTEVGNMEPIRISAREAHEGVQAGRAILVCGYEDDAKFKTYHLGGAISFKEFQSRLPSLSKSQEIVFYCA
jgi:hypothetical protein